MRIAPLVCLLLFASIAAAQQPVITARVMEGGIEPQLCVDSRGFIHILYFKGSDKGGDLTYCLSKDQGATFQRKIRVNSKEKSVTCIGAVRGPRMAIDEQGRPHVIWTGNDVDQPSPRLIGLALMYSSLKDDGQSFNAQRSLIASGFGIDGGASIAIDPPGHIAIAWHAPSKADGDETSRRVFVMQSTNEGATFSKPRAIGAAGTGACACCATETFFDADHRLNVIFRTARELVHRDMMLLTLGNDGRELQSTTLSAWNVGKCVMSTSSAAGNVIAVESQDHVLVFSDANQPPIQLGKNNPKHPRVAVSKDQVLVAWTEETGWNKGGKMVWQLFNRKLVPLLSGEGKDLPVWDYPAVATMGDGTFLVFY